MGTRCDFYAGRGVSATYLGSVARDGYPDEMASYLAGATTREAFDSGLSALFAERGGVGTDGAWPWPWKDSHTTDSAIAFDAGRLWVTHHSGRWAPLNDMDNPGDEPVVVADMASAEEATAEGRLRRRLRLSAGVSVGPQDDVLMHLLFKCALLLAKDTLHVFQREDQYYCLRSFDGHSRYHAQLFDIFLALRPLQEEFRVLLNERKARHAEPEWELLDWLFFGPAWTAREEVSFPVAEDLPFYFGFPLPQEELDSLKGPLTFVRIAEPAAFGRAMELLDLLLDRAPGYYAVVLAETLLDFGVCPVTRAEAEAWLAQPLTELGNQSLEGLCASKEGRMHARRYAWSLVFEKPFQLEVFSGAVCHVRPHSA
jgi:hypothetical protein